MKDKESQRAESKRAGGRESEKVKRVELSQIYDLLKGEWDQSHVKPPSKLSEIRTIQHMLSQVRYTASHWLISLTQGIMGLTQDRQQKVLFLTW